MRLCVFDAGQGHRLGVVRKNHIVDVAAVDATLPGNRSQAGSASPEVRMRLAGLADFCPHPAMLLRRTSVRILDEWDEPNPSA